jgi:hypothetical protein
MRLEQELGVALEGRQRVADLVGEHAGHFAERREAAIVLGARGQVVADPQHAAHRDREGDQDERRGNPERERALGFVLEPLRGDGLELDGQAGRRLARGEAPGRRLDPAGPERPWIDARPPGCPVLARVERGAHSRGRPHPAGDPDAPGPLDDPLAASAGIRDRGVPALDTAPGRDHGQVADAVVCVLRHERAERLARGKVLHRLEMGDERVHQRLRLTARDRRRRVAHAEVDQGLVGHQRRADHQRQERDGPF